jgi:type III secretion apparatus needle protein
MGSAISSIGNAIGGVVKSVESSIGSAITNVAKSVAPAVTDMLENVAHGAIGGLGNAVSGLVGNIPLVGGLLQNLVGKGVQGLDGLADGGISGLVNGLVGSLGNMLNVGGQNVTTPSLGDRAATAPASTQSLQDMIKTILAQLQGAKPATTTSSGAATGTSAPSTTTGSSAATGTSSTGGAVSSGGDPAASLINSMPGMPQIPSNMNDPKAAAEYQQAMMRYTETMNLISTVLKDLHDIKSSIIRNTAG